ncbi:MAG: hypothetical protein VX346_14100 [Planctomycetota bacterium]|nr:hypothetical protein [Planctomycetota bacterium]
MKTRKNPLYPLMGLVGFLFSVTAFAYFVMSWRAIHSRGAAHNEHALMDFIDQHGILLLALELGLLAVLTFGIMATDREPPERPTSRPGKPAAKSLSSRKGS